MIGSRKWWGWILLRACHGEGNLVGKGMGKRDEQKEGEGKSGKFRRLVAVVAWCLVGLIAVAFWYGCSAETEPKWGAVSETRDLPLVLKEAYDRGYALTLTDAEVTAYVGRVVRAKQTGASEKFAKFEKIWVKFSDGYGELVMKRRVFGVAVTQSVYFRIEQNVKPDGSPDTQLAWGGPSFFTSMPKWKQGGKIGQLGVPQGFLLVMMPSLEKLSRLFSTPAEGGGWESDLKLGSMARISIQAGKMVFEPESAAAGQMPAVPSP